MTATDDERARIVAAQGGDRDAMDALLRAHHDRIYALCRRLTGNVADAQDATQEALIAIVRGLRRFDGRAAFTTWSYRVATNACLDELRRRRRRPAPLADDLPERAPEPGAPSAVDTLVDRMEIDRALATLPIEFRTAVVLRDLCGLDYAAIAEVLDVPVGTVRSRIARGRAGLAGALGGNQPDPTERLRPKP